MANEELRITVTAKADQAERELKEVAGYADQLSKEDIDLVVRARTEAAEADLKALRKRLAQVSDPADVKVVLEGIGRAEGQIKELNRLGDSTELSPVVDLKGADDARGALEGMADAAGNLPGPLGAAAGFMTGPGGIAAAGAAAAAGIVKLASSAADAALEAKSLQAAVGGSTEETSRLLAATANVGLEYNDVLELVAEANKAMTDNADEAQRLGVNLSGTPIERFQQLVDAVYAIADPLERSAAASKFFGEEGSKQLPTLIGQYGDLATAMESVSDAAIVSEEDVAKAREYSVAMAGLKTQLGALAVEGGRVAIPVLSDLATAMGKGADAVGWLDNQFDTLENSIGALVTGNWNDFVNTDYSKVEEATISTEDLATAITGQLIGAMSGVADATRPVIDAMQEQADATDAAREANELLRDDFYTSADASIEVARTAADLADTVAELGKDTDKTRQDTEKLYDAVTRNADAQVKAAGVTRESSRGAKIYNDAILNNAKSLGSELTPEIIDYIASIGLIPEDVLTDIRAALERGDIDTAVTLLAGIDATTASPDIDATLDRTEFNEANRLADELDRRRVAVKIGADTSQFFAGLAGVTGASTRAAANNQARYVWRNGHYVQV